jgi:hypothetical protein
MAIDFRALYKPTVPQDEVMGRAMFGRPGQFVSAQPVAAQPIQVASAPTNVQTDGGGLANFVRKPVAPVVSQIAPQPTVVEPSVKPPPPVLTEPEPAEAEPTEADPTETEDATETAALKKGGEEIIAAANEEAAKDPSLTGEFTLESIVEQSNKARTALNRLTDSETDDSLEGLFQKLGLDKDYSPENYNAEAKKLLGIEEEESDVPDWAAPIFLFGLQLMKGPQTAKTGQQGLGGLLGDIGAAGTVAFKEFGAERARKQAQRANIANLATKLRTQDTSLRKQVFNQYLEKKKFDFKKLEGAANKETTLLTSMTNLYGKVATEKHQTKMAGLSGQRLEIAQNKALREIINDVNTRVTSSMKPYLDKMLKEGGSHNVAAFSEQVFGGIEGLVTAEEREGKTALQIHELLFSRLTQNPGQIELLAAKAATDVGIPSPIKIDKYSIGGREINVDVYGLGAAVREYNKRRTEKGSDFPGKVSYTQAISLGLGGTPEFKNFVLTENKFSTRKDTVQGVVYNTLIDETKRNAWRTANPGKQPTKEDVATWETRTGGHIEAAPEFKEFEFIDKGGVKQKIYIDEAKLARSKFDLNDVINDPKNSKYKGIIRGTISDYSDMGAHIKTTEIYENGNKQKVMIDYRALAEAQAAGKIDPNSPYADALNLGIIRRIGGAIPAKEAEMIQTIDADGNYMMVKAADAKGIVAAFTSKKDQTQFRQERNAVLNLNRSMHELAQMLTDSNAIALTSKGTDVLGALSSLGTQFSTQFGTNMTGFVSAMKQTGVNNTAGQQSLKSAFSDSNFDKFLASQGWSGERAERGAIKSVFISLAFDLASAREGGKLTDNDVKNALETLGWDGSSWTQTPQEVLARMTRAAQTANEKLYSNIVSRMPLEEQQKLRDRMKVTPENPRPIGVVEKLLRDDIMTKPDYAAPVMKRLRKEDPGQILRFDVWMRDKGANSIFAPGGTNRNPSDTAESAKVFNLRIPDGQLGVFSPRINDAKFSAEFKPAWEELKVGGIPMRSGDLLEKIQGMGFPNKKTHKNPVIMKEAQRRFNMLPHEVNNMLARFTDQLQKYYATTTDTE